MGMVEKVRIACVKRGNISEAELARRVGVTPQNFNHKMKRDNFTETDLREIAAALGLELDISFIDPKTGEKI
ncbi:MAG: transcriptional regulator [Clostridia bacterium]|nr:transcriptional regulator [Clostridia bacterium]